MDLDLRWGHDFAITANKDDEAPRLGFSAGAFNVLNHVNGSGIDPVETSTSFGQITSVAPPAASNWACASSSRAFFFLRVRTALSLRDAVR